MAKTTKYLGLHDMKWNRLGWDQNVRSSNRPHDLSKVCDIASIDWHVLFTQTIASKPSSPSGLMAKRSGSRIISLIPSE
jgi:hypothetical protein